MLAANHGQNKDRGTPVRSLSSITSMPVRSIPAPATAGRRRPSVPVVSVPVMTPSGRRGHHLARCVTRPLPHDAGARRDTCDNAPVVDENGWRRLLAERPGHSRWYIERFRAMARNGEDLAGEARLVDAMVHRHARILDAGCGPGRVG